MKLYTVNITYFKQSGKFYSNASFETVAESGAEILDEFKDMVSKGAWPGLVSGPHSLITVLTCDDHPTMCPMMVQP